MYNEPDLRWAYTGTWDDYVSMFRAGARGIVRADPSASIIAPAMAVPDKERIPRVLSAAAEERINISGVSVHAYGEKATWQAHIAEARAALEQFPEFNNATIHLNELNVEVDQAKRSSYTMASRIFSTLVALLEEDHLGMVNWAQFQDSGCGDQYGLVDVSGLPRASYNAFLLWSQMPMGTRSDIVIPGSAPLEGVASSSSTRCTVALWSSGTRVSGTVMLNNIPFESADVTLFTVNSTHGVQGVVQPDRILAGVSTASGIELPLNVDSAGLVLLQIDRVPGIETFLM